MSADTDHSKTNSEPTGQDVYRRGLLNFMDSLIAPDQTSLSPAEMKQATLLLLGGHLDMVLSIQRLESKIDEVIAGLIAADVKSSPLSTPLQR